MHSNNERRSVAKRDELFKQFMDSMADSARQVAWDLKYASFLRRSFLHCFFLLHCLFLTHRSCFAASLFVPEWVSNTSKDIKMFKMAQLFLLNSDLFCNGQTKIYLKSYFRT